MAQERTKAAPTPRKDGRNSDGTFAPGNDYGKNPFGRPAKAWSIKEQAKVRATKDPKIVKGVIDTLIVTATDPENPKCIEAADKLIKLLGNYDATENKTELSGSIETTSEESAINQLTREDLLKALKRKR